jgi:hypothetical protein
MAVCVLLAIGTYAVQASLAGFNTYSTAGLSDADELQNIPSARDPWVVMQSVSAVYVDRVNVDGSASGDAVTTDGADAQKLTPDVRF